MGVIDDVETAKAIIRRGWDDHMWNFEMMDERDEAWLLFWAEHPSAPTEQPAIEPVAGETSALARITIRSVSCPKCRRQVAVECEPVDPSRAAPLINEFEMLAAQTCPPWPFRRHPTILVH